MGSSSSGVLGLEQADRKRVQAIITIEINLGVALRLDGSLIVDEYADDLYEQFIVSNL